MSQAGWQLGSNLWLGLAVVLVIAIVVRRLLPAAVKGAIAGVYVVVALLTTWAALFGLVIPFNPVPVSGLEAVTAVPVLLLMLSMMSGGLVLIVPAALGAAVAKFLKRRAGVFSTTAS